MTTPVYECDQCGACCEFFMAFATHVDCRREPKLMDADLSGQRIPLPMLAIGHQVILSQGPGNPCQMLTKEKQCGIYPTRPTRCVEFEPGSSACQQAREGLGHGPLLPKQPCTTNDNPASRGRTTTRTPNKPRRKSRCSTGRRSEAVAQTHRSSRNPSSRRANPRRSSP